MSETNILQFSSYLPTIADDAIYDAVESEGEDPWIELGGEG